MDEQLNISIEPYVCSQILDNNYDLFATNVWEDTQLIGFISLYLPEVVQLHYKDEQLE
ncbi:MAG: hypothetical protein H6696_05705 [Deferribacteres bacterium]|nr:hypothetical protein [candidate division KSB1 bacterium]MCB9501411.1 hypothetical protein [Deferribacteres bacterium]